MSAEAAERTKWQVRQVRGLSPTTEPSITFIINGNKAGTERKREIRKEQHPQLVNIFEKNGWNAKRVYTEYKGHAADLVDDAVAEKSDVIVVVGGDGTVNDALGAQTLMQETPAAILGVLPGGSRNVTASALGSPKDLAESAYSLVTGQVKYADLLQVQTDDVTKNGLTSAGMGITAHVVDITDRSGKKGLPAYTKIGLVEWAKYQGNNLAVINHTSGDETEYDNVKFLEAINAGDLGRLFNVTDSRIDDGKFETVIFEGSPTEPLRAPAVMAYGNVRRHIPSLPAGPGLLKPEPSNHITVVNVKGPPPAAHIDGEFIARTDSMEIFSLERKQPMLVGDQRSNNLFRNR